MHLLNSGETFAYECLPGKTDSCFRDSIEEPLTHAGLSAAVDTIARVLGELVNEWDERVEAERLTRLGEALTQQYKPLFTIPSGDGFLEVLASDGFELPEHGAFIDLGDCVAIAETTYAYVRDSRAESGLARIEPVGLIAIYTRSGEGLRLSEVKPFAPKRDHAITVCGRPVRVKRAAAAVVVGSTTFADAKVFEAVLEMGDSALKGISWPSVASEILDRLRESVYLKDERKYYVLASYVLMTYFHDVFTAIPFLWLYGPYGSGKTRTNVTITYMSRRGVIILQHQPACIGWLML
ncbi:MAG: hypothetical protein GSR81_06035 [Desulfurococcales archaeon]|nr:hypothetical protein [Desulfurococcales archaeon]